MKTSKAVLPPLQPGEELIDDTVTEVETGIEIDGVPIVATYGPTIRYSGKMRDYAPTRRSILIRKDE